MVRNILYMAYVHGNPGSHGMRSDNAKYLFQTWKCIQTSSAEEFVMNRVYTEYNSTPRSASSRRSRIAQSRAEPQGMTPEPGRPPAPYLIKEIGMFHPKHCNAECQNTTNSNLPAKTLPHNLYNPATAALASPNISGKGKARQRQALETAYAVIIPRSLSLSLALTLFFSFCPSYAALLYICI